MLQQPENAHWFGFEYEGAEEKWGRLDEPSLGGKWYQVGTTTAPAMALRAFEIVGETRLRTVWAPKDRRYSLATSPPFSLSDIAPPPEPEQPQPVAEEPSPPAAPPQPPPVAETTPPPLADPVSLPPDILGGTPQNVAPVIPMPFTPPPPGTSESPLTTHVFIHSMVRQDMQNFQQMTLTMAQLMVETERARSRETLRAMELHYQSADRSRVELQRAMIEAGKEHPALAQMGVSLAQVKGELAALAQVEPEQDHDDQHDDEEGHTQQYSDTQVLIGTLVQLLNSPIGERLVGMLEKKGASAAGEVVAAAAAAE